MVYKVLQEEGWVVCRAFKKRSTAQTKNMEGWDSSYMYEESSGVSSVVDPLDHYLSSRQQHSFLGQNLLCKQELEAENLSFMQSAADSFVQLPQLESPSLPLMKRPSSSISLNNEEEEQNRSANKKVTDWRALDKFVASQLSQDQERFEGDGESSFGPHHDSDLALLLLQTSSDSGRDEGNNKLNGFLNPTSSDCDIGICIFDK